MFDMMKLMGKMKEVQEKIKEAQSELVNVTETAEAGGGMVKATVNGKKQVVELVIDDDLMKPADKQMLQDLVIAAVNKANQDVEEKARDHIRQSTEGLLPNIPGMDLGNFMG